METKPLKTDIQRLDEQRARDASDSAPSRTAPESPADNALPKDPSIVGELVPALQGPTRAPGRVHLVVGPVGAGKTTFARRLAHEHCAVRLTLDEWMTELFSPDRPEHHVVDWYRARAARSVDRIEKVAHDIAQTGTDVVLEIGLLTRRERLAFYRRCSERGLDVNAFVLDAARDVRRKRVMHRNRARGETFSMVVPPEFFEVASDAWEPPEPDEIQNQKLCLVYTDAR